jgi:primosomal protein N' (replication factor Y)
MFAEIILPLPLVQTYTYAVPQEFEDAISVGQRVVVNFGAKRFYTGVVEKIYYEKHYENLKPISQILDVRQKLTENNLAFWKQISEYYCAPLGDVYRAAVPSGLRPESETTLCFNEDFDETTAEFSDKEMKIFYEIKNHKTITINKLNSVCDFNVLPLLKNLAAQNIFSFDEEIQQKFKEKSVNVFVPAFVLDDDALNYISDSLKRAKKQQEAFLKIVDLIINEKRNEFESAELQKITAASINTLNSLVEKKILRIEKRVVSRIIAENIDKKAHTLTEEQRTCLEKIETEFEKRDAVLLHGVTSSGKTEIYVHLINKMLEQNRQVLYLVPETGLTSQLTERLQGIFGEKLLVYHSKISDAQRVEIWNLILQDGENSRRVVIGTRSAVLLPFNALGLIIIDEEHDRSFKQSDLSPRYNARSAAVFMARLFGAKILLGSATPSIESYANAQFGKFGFAELSMRFSNIEMPAIRLIDINEMYYKKRMKGHFSFELIEKIGQTLAKNEQVILFQNRRGFSLAQECADCGAVLKCIRCDVSLTLHKFKNVMSCHYCGFTVENRRLCAVCGSKNVSASGFGTEQVQQEAAALFPDAATARLDFDTTRKKDAFGSIISDFERRNIDILIGTQMVSKGIDFSNVGLVGIMNADNLMNFPDFRSCETAFQTLVQISGRAGRKKERGSVIVQTFSPQSLLLQCVKDNNYPFFFKNQMEERKMFNYPPYCRLAQLTLKHKDEALLQKAAEKLAEILAQSTVFDVLGPDNPPVAKVQYLFLRKILLKTPNAVSYKVANGAVLESIALFRQNPDFKYIVVAIDIDAV